MKRLLLAGLLCVGFLKWASAQSLTMVLPDTSTVSGDTLSLDIRVRDFERIVSMDFSMAWRPEVLDLIDFQRGALPGIAIGTTQAKDGLLRFSWFDMGGVGRTLADESVLVVLTFVATGAPGDSTTIRIQDEPLPVEIRQTLPGAPDQQQAIGLQAAPGVVRLVKPLELTWSVKPVSCYGASDGSIALQFPDGLSDAVVSWSGPGSFTASGQVLTGLLAGDYAFELRAGDGSLLLERSIRVSEPASAPEVMDIQMEDMGCEERAVAVNWSVAGGLPPYQYRIGEKVMTDTFLSAMGSGIYTLQVADANNCIDEKTFEISAPKIPFFDLGAERAICNGEALTLSPGTTFASYQWSTGSVDPAIVVNRSGSYSVQVTNESGCVYADTVRVITGELPLVSLDQSAASVCPGEELALRASGAVDYLWLDTSATLDLAGPDLVRVSPVYPSLYQVVGSNTCGSDTAAILVAVFPIGADAGMDSCIVEGTSIRLQASGAISYYWLPTEYPVSDPTVPDPEVQPLKSTLYKVVMTDENGCSITDSVFIEVLDNELGLPRISLITPNGDGKNDVLFFPKAEKYGNNVLRVYNRWGNIVYQKINYQRDEERFDGTYQGKPLPDGNYYYVLAFREKTIKQTLTILRN